MMTKKQKELIYRTVDKMIDNTSHQLKLDKLIKKHNQKLHFIPKRYRIFGGILQSLNIQFGNFIEELMTNLIENDDRYEILYSYSGKKSNAFTLSDKNDEIIDQYISKCQVEVNMNSNNEFEKLKNEIVINKNGKSRKFKHDIDLLFKEKSTGVIYYVEIKYNDDHDTGKFIDINRKLIKTYAYLIKEFEIDDVNKLVPILFYFNNKKMKGNNYLPEETNIYRGKKFFDRFLKVKYDDLDRFLNEFSESDENLMKFNSLYNSVMNL